MENVFWRLFESPLGPILLTSNGRELTGLRFISEAGPSDTETSGKRAKAPFAEVERQLRAYFRGELRRFDVPIKLEGTPFQRAAWRELRKIPYGATITYGEQAARMGSPKACRAVGGANRENPIGIIVPCHRVIGSDGRLTGFAGMKKRLDLKAALLTLEKAPGFRL